MSLIPVSSSSVFRRERSVQENYNYHQDLRDPGLRRRKYNLGTTTPVMLRFARLRRAEGHVAFAVPGSKISAMASADSRRTGNGGSVGGAFQLYLDSLRQELRQRDPTLLSVVVALVAVLLTLGKEAAGRYGGCRAGGDLGLDWACAERGRGTDMAPGGRLERGTHPLYQPALLPEAVGAAQRY